MLLNFIYVNLAVLVLTGVLALLLYKKRRNFTVIGLRVLMTFAIVAVLYLFTSMMILSSNYLADVYWYAYIAGWPLTSFFIGVLNIGILIASMEVLEEDHGKNFDFMAKFFY